VAHPRRQADAESVTYRPALTTSFRYPEGTVLSRVEHIPLGALRRTPLERYNPVNGTLRRLRYSKGKKTGHGFRAMTSTFLNEQGWNRDVIERQFAHA